MNTRIQTSADSDIPEGAYISVCTELSSDALPKVENSSQSENSDTGVSTHFVPLPKEIMASRRAAHQPHWYAIRCTYGRERKAYEFFSKNGIEAFYPTITNTKSTDGKTETIVESRLPNLLFAFGSYEQLKKYVFDNHDDTKYLRFYYNMHHDGTKEPLVVPQWQMISLMKICDADAEDKHLEPFVVEKFKVGQLVRVKDGPFAGVEGIVKRYKGQQRIGIVVDGLFTITTAYIAKDKLEVLELTNK